MAVLSASFKVLAMSLAFMILALTPISSLTFWVEGGSEMVYSSPSYTVTYKPSILNKVTGSNETRVKVEVRDQAGRPLEFIALLSGPTSSGATEAGNVSGKGYGVKAIGRYVSEVKRLLRELNSDPESTGIGMLVLISSVIEENGEYYAVGDAVSVPIIPGKAVGKDIVVSVKLRPMFKYKVKVENVSRMPEDQSLNSTPPSRITHKCEWRWWYTVCYYWKLEEVIYVTPSGTLDYVPLMITLLDTYTGSLTRLMMHAQAIKLTQYSVTHVSLSVSFGIADPKTGISLHVVGEGWRKELGSGKTEETLYHAACEVYPSWLRQSGFNSRCIYLEGDGRKTGYPGYFDGDVIFSTGFLGRMWLLRYSYNAVYSPPGSFPIWETIRENDLAVWVVPAFDSSGKNIRFSWELDDWADGRGTTEEMLRMLKGNYTWSYAGSSEGAYSEFLINIYHYYQASPNLGLTIPVGALILAALAKAGIALPLIVAAIVASLVVGLNAGKETEDLYGTASFFYIRLVDVRQISGFIAKMKYLYKIKAEGDKERMAPLIILWPIAG